MTANSSPPFGTVGPHPGSAALRWRCGTPGGAAARRWADVSQRRTVRGGSRRHRGVDLPGPGGRSRRRHGVGLPGLPEPHPGRRGPRRPPRRRPAPPAGVGAGGTGRRGADAPRLPRRRREPVPPRRVAGSRLRRVDRGRGGLDAGWPSAGDRRPLELVEPGAADELESLGEVLDVAPLHDPDEDRLVALDDRRHAEDREAVDGLAVLGHQGLERPAGGDLLGDGVGVEPDALGRSPEHGFLGDLLSLVVAGPEGGEVEVEELLGEGVARRDAPQQRPDAGGALLVEPPLPGRRVALLDVGLVEGEGPEPHVPVAALPQAVDHGLVGVAGERAAVIPGEGELTSHGASRRTTAVTVIRAQPPPVYPAFPGATGPAGAAGTSAGGGAKRRAAAPKARPRAAPATTSEVWWSRT